MFISLTIHCSILPAVFQFNPPTKLAGPVGLRNVLSGWDGSTAGEGGPSAQTY